MSNRIVQFFRPPKAQSLAVLARGEAEEQDGSVERAVGNSPTRLLSEAVNQPLTDFAGPSGCVGAARQQRQQEVGARRLHVAVRFDRLHAEPCRGDESGKPPHDVRCVHHMTQHRAYGRLQRIAIEQGDGEGREVAVENHELPARLENPAGLGQRPLGVDQMRVDRVRDDKVEEGVRLPGRHGVADRE